MHEEVRFFIRIVLMLDRKFTKCNVLSMLRKF